MTTALVQPVATAMEVSSLITNRHQATDNKFYYNWVFLTSGFPNEDVARPQTGSFAKKQFMRPLQDPQTLHDAFNIIKCKQLTSQDNGLFASKAVGE